MYIPKHFELDDVPRLQAFMDEHRFATLVTNVEGEPFATHVPLLLDPAPAPFGTLRGHMARANPQWQSLASSPTLAIFHGPHAYVSPGWYVSAGPAVPTWNYAVVHAYGQARLMEGAAAVHTLLRALVDREEATNEPPWRMETLESGYLEHMAAQIVAFEIPIARLQGKAKLSQNRPPADRQRVADRLGAAPQPAIRDVAVLMQELVLTAP